MTTVQDYIYAVILFSLSSIGMMLGNKLAVAALPLPFTLVFIQNSATVVLLLAFCRKEIKGVNIRVIKNWVPIAILFTAMLFSSLQSFLYVNVSTVIILRNIGAVVTTVVEYIVLQEKVNVEIVASELSILFGAYLYGYKNANFNWLGFFWIFFNMCAQVAYGVTLKLYMSKKPEFTAMSKYTMSLLNNCLSLPLMLILIITSDSQKLVETLTKITFWGWFWVLFTCFLGFLISTSGFGLQKLVSATTFLVVNNLVKFFNIALGIVFLGDKMETLDGLGCFIALAGGAWYSYAIYNFKNRNKPAKVEEPVKKDAETPGSANVHFEDDDEAEKKE